MADKLTHNPQFMFRESELSRIQTQLEQNKSILLVGIRRTGKTQVVKEALFRFQQSGGTAHYLDVQNYVSLNNFYRDLLAVMPKSVKQKLNDKLSSVKTIPSKLLNWFSSHVNKVGGAGLSIEMSNNDDTLARYWEVLAEQLGQILKAHPTEQLPVIGIDELPFMLENLIQKEVPTAELTVMLASIRKLRDSGLKLIIAGSISMENLLDIHKIPHTVLGGLWRETIPPFTKEEAKTYLAHNLKAHSASHPDAINIALDKLPDYVPEFLSISVAYLQGCKDITEVEKTIEHQVMPHINRAFIHQFNERLIKHYDSLETPIAEQILDQIAAGQPQGTHIIASKMPTGYRQVLSKLQFDNFIIDGDNFSLRFSLNLIRLWWQITRGIQ